MTTQLVEILLRGSPFGIRTLQIPNWSGRIFIIPRGAFKDLSTFPEAGKPAAYFLVSEDRHEVYVGETDTLGERLKRHEFLRKNWTEIIAFTSPDFGKTEVRYLEFALIKRLIGDGLIQLHNILVSKKMPQIDSTYRAVVDQYIELASDALLASGYFFLGVSQAMKAVAKEEALSVFCHAPDVNANGLFSENGLLVLKGSTAKKKQADSLQDARKKIRAQMIRGGILRLGGKNNFIFTEDHLFASPSSAASIILARSANGLDEWKTAEGKSLNMLELKR